MSNLSIPEIDQYTVNITSATIPKKVAGLAGPFQVINLNPQATIWLADNPAVRDGSGIPLNPGSSLTWTGSQNTKELYAVLGTDTQSVGQTANVIIGASVQGWQQNPVAFALAALNAGVILVDSPIAVVPAGTLVTIPGGQFFPGATSLYDVSTLQSVYLNYFINQTPPHTMTLSLTWYAGPNGLGTEVAGIDRFDWTAADNSVLSGKGLPVRGSYLRVQAFGIGAGPYADSFSIFGSHRIWNQLNLNMGNRVLATANNAALGAGANMIATPPIRYDGPIIAQAYAGAVAAQPGYLVINDLVTGNFVAVGTDPGVVTAGSSRTAIRFTAVVPRSTWNAQYFNFGGAAVAAQLEVVAAPEGT